MDIHNIDEFLDLQDQAETNLLSTEQGHEEEWHSTAAPINEMLSSMDNNIFLNNSSGNNSNTDWELLKNGLDSLPGLTEIMGHGGILNESNDCITPDSLIKQPEQRITRSKSVAALASPTTTISTSTTTPKKKRTRAKKVYCICKQPYNGKPMVQCDRCQEWFHCACVGFDPDNEEDIDWICKSCIEGKLIKNVHMHTNTVYHKGRVYACMRRRFMYIICLDCIILLH
ncbi:uncharacterized protein BX663DRAFT_521358 [Cokeromyces recurvatus]|uniref:uncharacterized protein n=1 Tax=Cokeromyces recurvatus TaxID=90255 RepID=UPI00221EBF1F|nr:uncharacterized protein BX663DRAFT_521358 [Cokeromyces recurvatus]KAI7899337.1 hypothetical protein BX663DRAFT_521358 [Cokeromyces recurvatus]